MSKKQLLMCVLYVRLINLRGPNHFLSEAPFRLILVSTFPRFLYISGEHQRVHRRLVQPREETGALTLHKDMLSRTLKSSPGQ